MVPPSDPPLVECLEAFHRVLVGVFGQIVDPETKGYISTFVETFMWKPCLIAMHLTVCYRQFSLCLTTRRSAIGNDFLLVSCNLNVT